MRPGEEELRSGGNWLAGEDWTHLWESFQHTAFRLEALPEYRVAAEHGSSQRWGWHNRQRELAAMEQSSSRLRYFLPSVITGLLQTEEYASQAVSRPVRVGDGDQDKTAVVARKMDRQRVLFDTSRNFTFLLTEAALRWQLVSTSATVETSTGLVLLRNPKDITYYSGLFDFFSSHALKGGEARDFIRAIADEFRSSEQNE